jgi:hypothetical protein
MNKVLCLVLLLLGKNVSAQFTYEDFKMLHQLEGKGWEMKLKVGSVIEKWTKINDSLLTSVSYRIREGDTTALETVELRFSNGIITYTPTVVNQNAGKPVTFALVSIEAPSSFTFENKNHDYPVQIIYRLKPLSMDVTLRLPEDSPGRDTYFNFTKL